MPYKTEHVDPEVFLSHENVTIYHIYKLNSMEDGRRTYWYGYDINCTDDGDYDFDVRELPNFKKDTSHEEIIKEAIDLGIITQEGIQSI